MARRPPFAGYEGVDDTQYRQRFYFAEDVKIYHRKTAKAMICLTGKELMMRICRDSALSFRHSIGGRIHEAIEGEGSLRDTVLYWSENIERVTYLLTAGGAFILPTATIFLFGSVGDTGKGLAIMFSFRMSLRAYASKSEAFAAIRPQYMITHRF